MVSGPAVGLIVTAILGFVVQASSIAFRSFSTATNPFINGNAPPGFNPEALRFFTGPMSIVFGLIGVAVGVVILIGALKMKKLESREWAMTSSILAMIPCISPCCIVGLPIGIWALVVLSKPELKNAFR
jgi:prolipoprotein diacylglyceryltransferase